MGVLLPQEEGCLHVLHPDAMVIGVVEDVREELYSTARSSLLDSSFFWLDCTALHCCIAKFWSCRSSYSSEYRAGAKLLGLRSAPSQIRIRFLFGPVPHHDVIYEPVNGRANQGFKFSLHAEICNR